MSSSISAGPAYSAGGGEGGGDEGWTSAGRPPVMIGRGCAGAAIAGASGASGSGAPSRKAWRSAAQASTSAIGGPLSSPNLPGRSETGRNQRRAPSVFNLVVI